LLLANRMRKGYYVRKVKDGLWAVFGAHRIKPVDEHYNKDQIKAWKESDEAKSVHDDLYKPSNPNDELSNTNLTLIIKHVFTEKEITLENAIWVQAVLEAIFDVDHLSTKIDNDVIDIWKDAIGKKEVISIVKRIVKRVVFLFFFLFFCHITKYYFCLG